MKWRNNMATKQKAKGYGLTKSEVKTLDEGLDLLESNLSYEDFDHLNLPDLPEDEIKRDKELERLIKAQEAAITNARIAIS
jgi:hypothetical protein